MERSELERAEAEKEVLHAQMRALEERMAKVRGVETGGGEAPSVAAVLPTVAVPEVGALRQVQSLRPAGRISSDSSVSVAEAEAEEEEDTRTPGRWRSSVPRSASLFLRNKNKAVNFDDGEGGSPREEEDVTTRGLGVPRNFSFGGGKRARIEAERERERAKAKVRARLEREAELELLAEKAEKDRVAAVEAAEKEERRDNARAAAAALKEAKAAAPAKKAAKQTAVDKDVDFAEADLHDEFSSNMDEGGTSYEEDASATGLEYVSTRGKVPNAPPPPPKILYAPVVPGPTPKEIELKRVKTLKEAHERANAKKKISNPSTTVDVMDECVVGEVVADTAGTSSEEEDDGDLFFDDDAEMVAEEVSVPTEQARNIMFTPANSNSPVSAASLAAASRARIQALEAGYKVPSPSNQIFGGASPAGPVREKPGFKPVLEESPFSSVRLRAIPRSASEAPRRLSAADTTAQQQLEELQSLRERMYQEQLEQQRKAAMAIPRSASLYSSTSAHSSSVGSTPSQGRRHPGQMMVASKTFSPHSTAGSPGAFDALDQPHAFKTPTGWSTRPVEVPKAEKIDPKRQREEQRIKEAREKSHKLSPDDPNYRRRRRTAAVNLVDAFKEEEKAPIPEVSVARIPRSASSRVAGISGGPSFRRNKSRKAAVH